MVAHFRRQPEGLSIRSQNCNDPLRRSVNLPKDFQIRKPDVGSHCVEL
jgi:hypothetical protein